MAKIRKFLLVFFLGFFFIFLQGTIFGTLFGQNLVPNLLLVMVVYLAFYEVSPFGAVLAFVLGLQMDVCAGLLLGPVAASFCVAYGILAAVSQRVFIESVIAIILAAISAVIMAGVAYGIIAIEFIPARTFDFSALFYEAGITACFAPLEFKLLRTVLSRVEQGHGVGVRGGLIA